jgi:acetyl-CoA acetyltransferase
VGEQDVVVAGGAESMTRSTWSIPKPPVGFARQAIEGRDTMWSGAGGPYNPVLVERGDMIEMPETAQNLADRYGISRAEQDAYALRSHERAAAARASGRFAEEIVPIEVDGEPVARDETIREDSSLEKLARLRPAFPGVTDITAGNSSQINDGASALRSRARSGRASSGSPRSRRFARPRSSASTRRSWASARRLRSRGRSSGPVARSTTSRSSRSTRRSRRRRSPASASSGSTTSGST